MGQVVVLRRIGPRATGDGGAGQAEMRFLPMLAARLLRGLPVYVDEKAQVVFRNVIMADSAPGFAAMRKLAHLVYGVVESGKPFDANFAMNRVVIQDGIGPRALRVFAINLEVNSCPRKSNTVIKCQRPEPLTPVVLSVRRGEWTAI